MTNVAPIRVHDEQDIIPGASNRLYADLRVIAALILPFKSCTREYRRRVIKTESSFAEIALALGVVPLENHTTSDTHKAYLRSTAGPTVGTAIGIDCACAQPPCMVAAPFRPEPRMARDQVDATPIETRDELVAWFEAGSKPKSRFRIGTEHEKFVSRSKAIGRFPTTPVAAFARCCKACSTSSAGSRSWRTATSSGCSM